MPIAPNIANARATIQQKIADLRSQLDTLLSALAVLGGKLTTAQLTAPTTTTRPKRHDYKRQFDAMMDLLTDRKGRTLTPAEIREALRASGKYDADQNSTTLWNHLATAARRGLLLKQGNGYRISPTIQKITQKAAPKPHAKPGRKKRAANLAHSRKFRGDVYDATIQVVKTKAGPATKGDIRRALAERKMPTTAINGHLNKAVHAGILIKKGSGPTLTYRPKEA